MKARSPDRYAQVGRLMYEGVPDGALVAGEHAD